MLSLGCVAWQPDQERKVGRFSVNLKRLPADVQTAGNKRFWDRFPDAFAATRVNTIPPTTAMVMFRDFVRDTCAQFPYYDGERKATRPAKAVCLAYPGAWDFGTWIYWYFNAFLGEDMSPFGHRALDLRTMISMVLNIPYSDAYISAVPEEMLPRVRQERLALVKATGENDRAADHISVDDADEQLDVYIALRKRWKQILAAAASWENIPLVPSGPVQAELLA
jgi:hypothetical protein